MDGVMILIVALVVLVALAAIAWMLWQRRVTTRLRDRFGPEYNTALESYGSRSKAEAELQGRREEVQRLKIIPLSPDDAARSREHWQTVQSHFVDDPAAAIGEADTLVNDVMEKRGYPMADFERQSALVSVDHPQVVSKYRSAHGIAEASKRSEASTEDLRQGMIHYRSLFSGLLGDGASLSDARRSQPAASDRSAPR